MVKNLSIYVWCVVLAVLLALLLREAWVVAVEHVLLPDWEHFEWNRLSWPNVFKRFNLGLYWWFTVGIVAYLILRIHVIPRCDRIKDALEMQEIDSHESSHSFVAMLLGRRVSEKVVKKNSGHIMSSGPGWSHMFTSLAPYTLPLVTYLGLAFRSLIAWQSTWLFDIIVGMTMGFYIYRHMTETRDYQPDINHFRTKLFPYLYIAVWTVFNFNVITVTFWSSKNFFTALWWVLQHLVVW